jgi:hypothetical protein
MSHLQSLFRPCRPTNKIENKKKPLQVLRRIVESTVLKVAYNMLIMTWEIGTKQLPAFSSNTIYN